MSALLHFYTLPAIYSNYCFIHSINSFIYFYLFILCIHKVTVPLFHTEPVDVKCTATLPSMTASSVVHSRSQAMHCLPDIVPSSPLHSMYVSGSELPQKQTL